MTDDATEPPKPLDDALRAHLKRLHQAKKFNVEAFAEAVGRSKGWVSKYINGAGHATIDDVVRMMALLIGVERRPLTNVDRRLLRVLTIVPEERHEDLLIVLETSAKSYLHLLRQGSTEQADDIRAETGHKGRGRRRGGGARKTTA